MTSTAQTTGDSKAEQPVSGQPAPGATFVTTRWTAVVAAGQADTPNARIALESLCQTYWYPLYAYVRRSGRSPEDSKDLTQTFFAQLLERNSIAKVDRERGRFRSFLLTSLKNFLVNDWEKSRALKRGGAAHFVPLQFDTAEIRFAQPIAPGDTPDRAFDRQWALALLEVVLDRLRREFVDAGKENLFLVLKDTLSGGRSEIPYRDLAARLAMSEGAVKVAAHRLRQRYRELLREEIASTLADTSDVETELRELFAALS